MQSASDQSRGHFVRVTWIRVYRDEFWNDFSMRLLIIIHSSVKFLMSFCTLLINYSRQVLMPLASDYVAVLAVLGVVATLPRCQAARAHLRVHLWHRGPQASQENGGAVIPKWSCRAAGPRASLSRDDTGDTNAAVSSSAECVLVAAAEVLEDVLAVLRIEHAVLSSQANGGKVLLKWS